MARIEAEVDANIGPFERALKQATGKAREFANQAKDITTDIGKDSGAGGIMKFLGVAGGAAAVTAFGASLVEALKGGVEEASDLQQRTLQIKYNLSDPSMAKEVAEWAESLAGAGGDAGDITKGLIKVLQAGMQLKDAQDLIIAMREEAVKTGHSLEEMGDAFFKASAGGAEGELGSSKLLKAFPGLKQDLEPLIAEDAETFARRHRRHAIDPLSAEDQAEYDKLKAKTPAQFIKEGGLTQDLFAQLIKKNAPTGAVADQKNTFSGAMKDLQQQVRRSEEELGNVVLPTLTTWLKTMTEDLRNAGPQIKDFGDFIKDDVIPGMKWLVDQVTGKHPDSPTIKAINNIEKPADTFLENIGKTMSNATIQAIEKLSGKHLSMEETNKLLAAQNAWMKQFFEGGS